MDADKARKLSEGLLERQKIARSVADLQNYQNMLGSIEVAALLGKTKVRCATLNCEPLSEYSIARLKKLGFTISVEQKTVYNIWGVLTLEPIKVSYPVYTLSW